MSVAIAFALIGGIILIGFLANLLFRATKIPSVLILMAIGLVLGPVTGWVKSDALIAIAPFFGTLALLIILFEGGLELDIESVLKQASTAAGLCLLGFFLSWGTISALSFYGFHLPLLNSLLLGCILGAGSPAIIIPLTSGLSVRREIKTILKLESALGDVLLIVIVLFLLDMHASGRQSASAVVYGLIKSCAVALVISSVAGALWARLIGWMGKEPLAYMLTLGFVFLLYFGVEELGGSAALAVLMFGMILENMHGIADRVGLRVRTFIGIDIRAEQFVLQAFMKNITEELSFLLRTFFFVYLGLLLDFRALTPQIGIYGAAAAALIFGSRWLAVRLLSRKGAFTSGELQIVCAMLPRGLATAVMAFLPLQRGVPGTDLFPIYAFLVIVLTNIHMTGGVIWAEKLLKRERAEDAVWPDSALSCAERAPAPPETAMEPAASARAETSGKAGAGTAFADPAASDPQMPNAGADASVSFAARMRRLLAIRPEERERRYVHALRASSLGPPVFWVQIFLASILTALGLVLDQSSIIIGAALIVPIAWPVLAAGLALAAGDIYLLLKLLLKMLLVAAVVAVLCAVFSTLLPFNAVTSEIAARTRPTILDFLVALFSGMAGAALLFSRSALPRHFPGVLLGLALMPPLAVLGFGSGREFSSAMFYGAALLFVANFFAAILGAALIYAAAGMPETAMLESLRAWKQKEMDRPVTRFLFDRMNLGGIIGRAGSARARLMVIVVFLLALIIPLQMAFNQLSREFLVRQAIAAIEKMFEVPGRSAIVNSVSSIGAEEITVRIQVATNAFFADADIRRFEERIADRTGMPAKLDLVQSLSDIGAGKTLRGMLASSVPESSGEAPDIVSLAARLREAIENSLQAVSLPKSLAILGTHAELGRGQAPPSFRIDYVAAAPLSEDARSLLAGFLERRMGVLPGYVHFLQVPSRYEITLGAGADISPDQASRLAAVQEQLQRYPQLLARMEMPPDSAGKQLELLRRNLQQLAPLLADPARSRIAGHSGARRRLRILLQTAPEALSR